MAGFRLKDGIKKKLEKELEDARACGFEDGEISSWEVKIKFTMYGRRYQELKEFLDLVLSNPKILDVEYLYSKQKVNRVSLESLQELLEMSIEEENDCKS